MELIILEVMLLVCASCAHSFYNGSCYMQLKYSSSKKESTRYNLVIRIIVTTVLSKSSTYFTN